MVKFLKLSVCLRLLACLIMITTAGCGNSGEKSDAVGEAKSDDQPELSAVLRAFSGEDISMRSSVEEIARMVRNGMIQDAIPSLTKLSTNPKLNPDQKQSLESLITSLKTSAHGR